MSLSGLFTATFAGERCEKSRIVFFSFSSFPQFHWGSGGEKQRLTVPAGHRLLYACVCVRACACVRVSTAEGVRARVQIHSSWSPLIHAPHPPLAPPRIIGAAPSPHPRATPSPGPSSKGFTALTLAPIPYPSPFASCTRDHTRAALASQSHL